jgi:hypothetical protein
VVEEAKQLGPIVVGISLEYRVLQEHTPIFLSIDVAFVEVSDDAKRGMHTHQLGAIVTATESRGLALKVRVVPRHLE